MFRKFYWCFWAQLNNMNVGTKLKTHKMHTIWIANKKKSTERDEMSVKHSIVHTYTNFKISSLIFVYLIPLPYYVMKINAVYTHIIYSMFYATYVLWLVMVMAPKKSIRQTFLAYQQVPLSSLHRTLTQTRHIPYRMNIIITSNSVKSISVLSYS